MAGTRQAERRYVWDKAGAPTRIDDAIWGETTYRYDANGQVSESRFSDGFTEKFEYDAAKNVAGVSLKGPQLGAGLGKLLAWRSSAGGVVQLSHGPNGERVALTHDACGRVVIRRVDRKGFRPQTWAYGWDILDRLVRCDNPDGETWFYRYDAFGRRLSKVRKLSDRELAWTAQKYSLLVPVVARESTKLWSWPEPPNNVSASSDQRPPVVGVHFLWDGGVLSEEAPLRLDGTTDWASATRWHYEVNSFRPMAKESAEGSLLPIVDDHIGTPREVFCDSGSAQWAASYNTWGSVRGVQRQSKPEHDDGQRAIYTRAKTNEDRAGRVFAEDAALDCPLRFQGQWQDKENGLTYNFHRYYDAVSASYISSDPIGLRGGLRTQSYVMNPLCGIDPWGLRSSVPLREGEVGRFGDLDDRAVAGDNLTPHHIPSDKHNEAAGVSRRDGIAVMMRHEDHKNTFTYGGRNRGQGGDRALGTGAAISKGAGELPGMMPNMSPSQMDTIQSEIVRQNLEGPHPGVDIP